MGTSRRIWSRLSLMLLGILACLGLAGCGAVSKDDLVGDWTTTEIGGKAIEDYAADAGLTKGQCATNLTIRDDDTVVFTGNAGSQEFDIERKSNGFECRQKGSDSIAFSVLYDKDARTLSYEVDSDGQRTKFVFQKGSSDIQPAQGSIQTDTGADTREQEGDTQN